MNHRNAQSVRERRRGGLSLANAPYRTTGSAKSSTTREPNKRGNYSFVPPAAHTFSPFRWGGWRFGGAAGGGVTYGRHTTKKKEYKKGIYPRTKSAQSWTVMDSPSDTVERGTVAARQHAVPYNENGSTNHHHTGANTEVRQWTLVPPRA